MISVHERVVITVVENRNYYTFRRGTPKPSDGLAALRRIIASEYQRLEANGLFQWHFGKDCVDNGYMSGESAGTDPNTYVEWELGSNLWPFETSIPRLDEEWLFTVIEFLHDHAAAPTSYTPHTWGDCGIHVHSADEELGRITFRDSVNRYLSRYNGGFILQDNGEIWRSLPSGLADIQPSQTGESSIDERVQHAIATFRHRSATVDQKRDAVKNLADILEYLRENDMTGLPSKDEDRLFEIANQFAIRHFNSKQRTDYDSGVWLDWIFFAFLNAIALATALVARSSFSTDEGIPAGDLPFE